MQIVQIILFIGNRIDKVIYKCLKYHFIILLSIISISVCMSDTLGYAVMDRGKGSH